MLKLNSKCYYHLELSTFVETKLNIMHKLIFIMRNYEQVMVIEDPTFIPKMGDYVEIKSEVYRVGRTTYNYDTYTIITFIKPIVK